MDSYFASSPYCRIGMTAAFVSFLANSLAFAFEPPPQTTLSNDAIKYHVPEKPYVVLRRANIEAVVCDNSRIDDSVLPGHRAGYSGVAALRHRQRSENLFVPSIAGLNFEHIHDGVTRDRKILFEPRNWPMELRIIDRHTVELHQSPTFHFGLESCTRYALLEDGTIEMTFECIPRKASFTNGYIGLFWASYIHQPESLDIHFQGQETGHSVTAARWIRGSTPKHGVLSTHLATDDHRTFSHDDDFALTLVFNRSNYRYAEPWYFGISHGMALALLFRPQDRIRFSQSPSGGGEGNPAWDFQYFVPDYRVGQRYQMVMRAMYVPYESPEQMRRVTREHRATLCEIDVEPRR